MMKFSVMTHVKLSSQNIPGFVVEFKKRLQVERWSASIYASSGDFERFAPRTKSLGLSYGAIRNITLKHPPNSCSNFKTFHSSRSKEHKSFIKEYQLFQ